MKRALLLAMCALLVGACAVEENDDVVLEYGPNTMMGLIQKRGVMRIGLPSDRPPLSSALDTGPLEGGGFLVPIATELATSLGVEPEIVFVPNITLEGMIERDELDVAFPMRTITEEMVRSFNTTHPYFVAHQRLLVTSTDVDEHEDLEGDRVCTLIDDDTGVVPSELDSSIETWTTFDPQRCVTMLARGTVDAATAPDLLLAGMAKALESKDVEASVVGEHVTTEGIGAIVSVARPGLAGYVNEIFAEIEEEGRWTRWYNQWIGPYLPDRSDAPPTMTLAEAAALFPDEGAVIPEDDQG